MNPYSMIFLMVVMVGGLLIVTLFFYGGRFVLCLLEMPDAVRVQEDGYTAAVHTAASPHASALKHVVSGAPQPQARRA